MSRARRSLTMGVLCLFTAALVLSGENAKKKGTAKAEAEDVGHSRPVQDFSDWERGRQNLLWNFHNLYQPCVVECLGEEYPYKMWFFGWSVQDSNPGYPGSDAIFYARSKDLKIWEVYSGKGLWDSEMNPQLWVPIITAGQRPFDCWHNGDPSVVYKDGRYYMAFSATGMPDVFKGRPNGGMLSCIMGATSEDGIHWNKTDQPLLVEPYDARNSTIDKRQIGVFHRPCLMWDRSKWRLWFDYWHPTKGATCVGHAENEGDFDSKGGFRVTHNLSSPIIRNWPNPEMVRIGNHYHSFADPFGYPPNVGDSNRGWTARQLCEAVSEDGLNWKIVGYIEPDTDAVACHVPQTLITTIERKTWLYLFYTTQKGGKPYDYRYNRIRAIRREVKKGRTVFSD